MKPTSIADYIKPVAFLKQAIHATTIKSITSLLSQLPIVDENEYAHDSSDPTKNWVEGKFHWIPLGKDRGNAGRIKLASRPEGPIAERTINGMEALIELMRRLELLQDPSVPVPQSPREAVARYFSLPPLDQIPRMQKESARQHQRPETTEVCPRTRPTPARKSHLRQSQQRVRRVHRRRRHRPDANSDARNAVVASVVYHK